MYSIMVMLLLSIFYTLFIVILVELKVLVHPKNFNSIIHFLLALMSFQTC